MMVVSQQTSRQLLHAFHVPLPCSILPPGMLNQAADLSACPAGASRLLITTSMSNLKIELHVQELVGGAKD